VDSHKFIVAALLTAILVLGAYLLIASQSTDSNRPLAIAEGYLRATYARDFGAAYDHLSSADQRERTRQNFVNNQGSYRGFTLEVSRKLASFMKVWLLEQEDNRNRRVIKLGYRVPAPADLNGLLFNWDQDRLNALSQDNQKHILAELDRREQTGKLLKIEGQETIEFIEEAQGWKVFLDWAAGTHVLLQSNISGSKKIQVRLAATEVTAKNDELFLVNLRVENPNPHPVTFTVIHLVEPPAVADDLQLVECGLLTPTMLEARQEKEFAMAYQLNPAGGQTHRKVKLTYDFKLK
jgi:hypothetical protein